MFPHYFKYTSLGDQSLVVAQPGIWEVFFFTGDFSQILLPIENIL